MLIFVSGAARSGKSEWAERKILDLSKDGPRIYLATAPVCDEEMRLRVLRHREARRGRGFVTIERPRDIAEIIPSVPKDASVLLECLPNWLANEMFAGEEKTTESDLTEIREKIYDTALSLSSCCRNLVIVSDDIFSDGVIYDEATENYIRLLGELHVLLAAKADMSVEFVAGTALFFGPRFFNVAQVL